MSSYPLRVLHLVAIRGKGGTGASTLSLVEGLADRGHKVAVVCFKRGLLYQSLKDKGKVKLVTGIKMAPGFRVHHWIKDLVKLKPFVDEFRPQIIHTHSSPDYWLGYLLSVMTGTPLVRTRHVPVPLTPHAFNRWIFERTAAVVAVSHAVGDRYFSGVNWKPEKVRVVYDGVDTQRFTPLVDGKRVREDLGLSRENLLVGSVARYSRVKGLPFFLRALAEMANMDSRIRGLVIGRVKNEGLYNSLEDWLVTNKLRDRIFLWKHRDGVEEVLAALDVGVLASLGSEGSSRVALEAGACGKPMVVTTAGALPEVVVGGKTGFTVEPGDVVALIHALKGLIPPLKRKSQGINARRRAAELFSLENSVGKVESLYREILDG